MNYTVRRVAGTPLNEKQRQELRALASMPDDEIDFSDIPERSYPVLDQVSAAEPLPLEKHTLTLQVDAEVAAWLEANAETDPTLANAIIKRIARRVERSSRVEPLTLDRAS